LVQHTLFFTLLATAAEATTAGGILGKVLGLNMFIENQSIFSRNSLSLYLFFYTTKMVDVLLLLLLLLLQP
jgi:hypothetical protein